MPEAIVCADWRGLLPYLKRALPGSSGRAGEALGTHARRWHLAWEGERYLLDLFVHATREEARADSPLKSGNGHAALLPLGEVACEHDWEPRLCWSFRNVELFLRHDRGRPQEDARPEEREALRRLAPAIHSFLEEHLTCEPAVPDVVFTGEVPRACALGDALEIPLDVRHVGDRELDLGAGGDFEVLSCRRTGVRLRAVKPGRCRLYIGAGNRRTALHSLPLTAEIEVRVQPESPVRRATSHPLFWAQVETSPSFRVVHAPPDGSVRSGRERPLLHVIDLGDALVLVQLSGLELCSAPMEAVTRVRSVFLVGEEGPVALPAKAFNVAVGFSTAATLAWSFVCRGQDWSLDAVAEPDEQQALARLARAGVPVSGG